MSEYVFERVTPHHYDLLKDLYRDSFNLRMEITDIQKRFDTAELGCKHIGFLAIHATTLEPAAYYGVFPVTLKFNNRSILAAQSGDTMTHSKHRLKGLFTLLAKLTFEVCSNNKIEIIFGFPNDNSLPGFIKKLQWKQIDSIIRLDLKLKIKTLPIGKICMRSEFLRKLYYAYFHFVLRKKIVSPPRSFNNTQPCNYAKVLRDENYIEYKKSPFKFFIMIDKQVMWIKLTDIFWIGDFGDYHSTTDSAIRKLKKIAFFLGYNTVSFHINESVQPPDFLNSFRKYNSTPSCILSPGDSIEPSNILFTGADFDTW